MGQDSQRAGLVRFSPTVELGHLLQALVMLAAIGGWALAGYYTIQQQLNQQSSKMELFQQRLTTYETNASELRENLKGVVAETRTSFAKISDQISELRADLRGIVAGSGRGRDVPRR